MNSKILEVFQSVQGEGKYVGVQQVFVRFFECNIHCDWCDTPHSIGDTTRRYDEVATDELFEQIRELWPGSHSVSLTGGEPLIQKNAIKDLLPKIKEARMPVYLETNGILTQALEEIIDDVDIIAMDIKLPSSTKCEAFWSEHEKFLKCAIKKEVFIKTVITGDTLLEDVRQAVALVSGIDPSVELFLQPNYFDMKNGAVMKCREYFRYCSEHLEKVRIVPQMHKFMQLR